MLYVLSILFSLYFAVMWMGSFIHWVKSKSRKESNKYLAEIFVNTGLIAAFILFVEVLSK